MTSAGGARVVLFVDDDPKVLQAADFRDSRTPDAVLASFATFLAGRAAAALHDAALSEAESFHSSAIPKGLSESERKLFRQSESVLRMAQVREARQDNRENYGMLLATLPPGEWHTGWVRDASYSIASLSMTGHFEQARMGLEFLLWMARRTASSTRAISRRAIASRPRATTATAKKKATSTPTAPTWNRRRTLAAGRGHVSARELRSRLARRQDLARRQRVRGAERGGHDITTSVVDGLPAADASIWKFTGASVRSSRSPRPPRRVACSTSPTSRKFSRRQRARRAGAQRRQDHAGAHAERISFMQARTAS